MATLRRVALALVFGSLIFIGFPLLGWGLGDIQGFVDHTARLAYVVLTILLHICIVLIFPGVGRSGGDGKKLVQRQRWAVLLLQVIPLTMLVAAPYCDRREIAVMGDSPRYFGLILFTVGFLVVNWAEAALGKQFSIQVTIQEDHKLVTQGPYKFLRHPRYAGIILFNLGIALVFRSWLALLLVAALNGVLLWRIRDEESLMRQEFGAEWDAYASKVWHLIPFIY